MKQKNNILVATLIKILRTVGLCAGAFIILSLLSNSGSKPEPVKKAPLDKHFNEKKADKIIEAKIETWR